MVQNSERKTSLRLLWREQTHALPRYGVPPLPAARRPRRPAVAAPSPPRPVDHAAPSSMSRHHASTRDLWGLVGTWNSLLPAMSCHRRLSTVVAVVAVVAVAVARAQNFTVFPLTAVLVRH